MNDTDYYAGPSAILTTDAEIFNIVKESNFLLFLNCLNMLGCLHQRNSTAVVCQLDN